MRRSPRCGNGSTGGRARGDRLAARLFVYGTLQDEAFVERLIGRRLRWQPAILQDYCRTLDASIGYPVVRPLAGARVDGRLLEDVDRDALAAIDDYEGREYRRVPVQVQTRDGRTLEAEAYVPAAGRRTAI